jgi:Fe-S-cluster-containing hydrogenase component 2
MPDIREIVEIDEELCDGCGLCIPGCAEGALEIVDGKVRLVEDKLCDGLGACLGHCPTGALRIIERPAAAFDEEAVEERLKEMPSQEPTRAPSQAPPKTACQAANRPATQGGGGPGLDTWPIKLRLVPVDAPFLRSARWLLAADCAGAADAAFQKRLEGAVPLIGCPKFDDSQAYVEKLAEMIRTNKPEAITVLRMEVPCCAGLEKIAQAAVRISGESTPVETVIIDRRGGQTEQAMEAASRPTALLS